MRIPITIHVEPGDRAVMVPFVGGKAPFVTVELVNPDEHGRSVEFFFHVEDLAALDSLIEKLVAARGKLQVLAAKQTKAVTK